MYLLTSTPAHKLKIIHAISKSKINVQERPVIESCMAVATYLHQTYLGQQITTVRRWINECSSQTLVLRAANRPLRPRILTAFRADNIVHFYMHVSHFPAETHQQPLFGHICWTKVSLKCHAPIALSGHFQSSREAWEGLPGKYKMVENNT